MNRLFGKKSGLWKPRTLLLLLLGFAAIPAEANVPREDNPTGWGYYRQKRYDKALELLQKEQRVYPRSFKTIDGVGWCHYFLGDLGEAEKSFRKALEFAPDYNFSLMGLEYVHKARVVPIEQAESLLEAGKHGQARRACDAVLERQPDLPVQFRSRVFRCRGLAALRVTDYKEALKDLEQAVEIDPGDAAALAGIGYTHFACGKYKNAESSFEQALALAPDDLEAVLTHAWCAYYRNNATLAIERFTKALDRFPASWGACLGLGWSREKKGDDEGALALFRRALNLSGSAATTEILVWIRAKKERRSLLIDYGYGLFDCGNYTAALDTFDSMSDPDESGRARLGIALARLNLGDNVGVIDAVQSLADDGLDPKAELYVAVGEPGKVRRAVYHVSASSLLGWSLLRIGDYDDAAGAFEKAMLLPGQWTDAMTGLGYLHVAQNRHDEAERSFRGALEMLPGYPPALSGLQTVESWRYADYNRAWTLMEAGRLTSAMRIFNVLLRDPKKRFPSERSDLIDNALGRIARLEGDAATSARLFTSALKKNQNLAEALTGLGWAQLEMGDHTQAIQTLESAAARLPLDPEPRSLLARALAGKGRRDKALNLLSSWIKQFPCDAGLAEQYGRMLIEASRYIEACIAFQTVIALEPERIARKEVDILVAKQIEFAPLLGSAGWALYSKGRYSEARARFKAAFAKEPGDATHLKGLALTACALGNLDEAENHAAAYHAALGDSPAAGADRRIMAMTLAWAHYEAGDFRQALASFREIDKGDDEKQADVLCALGWTWLMLGKTRTAHDFFLKAVEIEPRLESALQGLEATASRKP